MDIAAQARGMSRLNTKTFSTRVNCMRIVNLQSTNCPRAVRRLSYGSHQHVTPRDSPAHTSSLHSSKHLTACTSCISNISSRNVAIGTYSSNLRRLRLRSACHALPEAAPQGKKRIAVFVSGGGSNFKAIHSGCLDGSINGEIVAVVSDVPTCGGVQYAQQHGIPTLTFPAPKSGAFPGLTSDQLVEALVETHNADLVILAGFLKLVPADVVRAFKRRILNIHPALLPSFGGKGYYGIKVHQAVVAAGVRITGPTVHFVDEEYDKGPIIAQTAVPVYPTDTPQQVAARVLKQEHQIYPVAVAAICDNRVTWREDGVPIIWNSQ